MNEELCHGIDFLENLDEKQKSSKNRNNDQDSALPALTQQKKKKCVFM